MVEGAVCLSRQLFRIEAQSGLHSPIKTSFAYQSVEALTELRVAFRQ
jgi:hypothetical protein